MVVFTCNACSAVLKRNQVDKHCYQCRRCESLSCVDCGKDFWGDDYQQHIKCITEEEKYGGKDNVPKVFKGEAKQEQWVEQVQSAIEQSGSKPKLKFLLERLRDYPNIPRKKAKFENFVKNSLRVQSPALIAEVWDLLMVTNNNNKTQNGNKEEKTDQKQENQSESNGHNVDGEVSKDQQEEPTDVLKSKRERKEERKQKAHKKEKKDKTIETEESATAVEVTKKSKKRKRPAKMEEEEEVEDEDDKEKENKKKKKRKAACDESITEEGNNGDDHNKSRVEDLDDEAVEPPPNKRKKMKFDWEAVIKAVLEKKGEMTLKKLKKKVLSEFAAQDAANYNDNLGAKFDKKILRTEGVKVAKDRASLKGK